MDKEKIKTLVNQLAAEITLPDDAGPKLELKKQQLITELMEWHLKLYDLEKEPAFKEKKSYNNNTIQVGFNNTQKIKNK